jgi:hypothetical protein
MRGDLSSPGFDREGGCEEIAFPDHPRFRDGNAFGVRVIVRRAQRFNSLAPHSASKTRVDALKRGEAENAAPPSP